jgi:hypothetical protein
MHSQTLLSSVLFETSSREKRMVGVNICAAACCIIPHLLPNRVSQNRWANGCTDDTTLFLVYRPHDPFSLSASGMVTWLQS